MKSWLTRYTLVYFKAILYMLQSTEYVVPDYLKWLHRTTDFTKVTKRRDLVWTKKIKLLAVAELLIATGVVYVAWVVATQLSVFGWWILLLIPYIVAYVIILPLIVGRILIQGPRERKIIASARKKIREHKGVKIAVAGSYGKTTTKQVLYTVIGAGKKTMATPGNMNTLIGNSRFIQSLDGDEDVVIFELGESHMGDIADLCDLVQPNIGVITGINEAHLETFKNIDNTVATIFALRDYVGEESVYMNVDDPIISERIRQDFRGAYSREGALGWKIVNSEQSLEGTEIEVKNEHHKIRTRTRLVGAHLLGTQLLAVAIADSLGVATADIKKGLESVEAFEHRMQPRKVHNALVIDDTYNGNIQGVEAGLQLLKESTAQRKIYVTPGLVGQGDATRDVHERIGRLIAGSANMVVLMKNSVTEHIQKGLDDGGFTGEVKIVDDPLEFYTNLEYFVAAGDVVLMQNDWTDNYA